MKVTSFGFRVELPPSDATLVLDARVVQNPFGFAMSDNEKRAWVRMQPAAQQLIKQGVDHLKANPNGHVAVGCLFGRHRSVAIAEAIRDAIRA